MRTADVAKLVSRDWKALDDAERAIFHDMAKRDKERYEKEKATYKGPWKVIDIKETAAPKQRVSEFLSFGSTRMNDSMAAIASTGMMIPVDNEVSTFLVDMFKDASSPSVTLNNKPKQMYRDETGQLPLPTTDDVLNQVNVSMALNSVPSSTGYMEEESRLSFPSTMKGFWVQQQQQQKYQPQQDEETAPSDMRTEVSQTSLSSGVHLIGSSNSSTANDEQKIVSENSRCEMDADAWLTNDNSNGSSVDNLTLSLPSSKSGGGFFGHMGHNIESSPFTLQPLISTDVGCFLAAAAIFDAPFDQIFESS